MIKSFNELVIEEKEDNTQISSTKHLEAFMFVGKVRTNKRVLHSKITKTMQFTSNCDWFLL